MDNDQQRLFTLTKHILHLMQKKGGPIPFHDWMQAALYAPGLGYYESEKIFGEQGDFTTAATMGNWLALALAESIYQGWEAMGRPDAWVLIEQGGGNGHLLRGVLHALKGGNAFPTHIYAVETSKQLRARQASMYQSQGFEVQVVSSLGDIPRAAHGVMFSNELPDAFPVRSFVYHAGQAIERGVDWDGKKFVWVDLQPITLPIPQMTQDAWVDGYISEFNPHLSAWQQAIADRFEQGMAITIDYGYTRQEYYRPTRIEGTLMGHYQHRVVEDVLKLSPGVCDITAHVDFTALKAAGEAAGLQAIAYTTQGAWLAQSAKVQQGIQQLATSPDAEAMAQISHAKRLMLPTGMGESFKVLIQSKGIDNKARKALMPRHFDRLHTLQASASALP